jgi:hypothetical protein
MAGSISGSGNPVNAEFKSPQLISMGRNRQAIAFNGNRPRLRSFS